MDCADGPYENTLKTSFETGQMAIGGMDTSPPGNSTSDNPVTASNALVLSIKEGRPVDYMGDPTGHLVYPIFDGYGPDKKVAATILILFQWSSYFRGVVPSNAKAVTLVLSTPCQESHTFAVDGEKVVYVGAGDLHDPEYTDLGRRAALNSLLTYDRGIYEIGLDELNCPYHLHVYPTKALDKDKRTYVPLLASLAVGIVFVFAAIVFLVYDNLVERRQRIVLTQATRSTALVSSFFPDAVRQRLLQKTDFTDKDVGVFMSPAGRIKNFLAGSDKTENDVEASEKPIADLFPFTTVLFADVSCYVLSFSG